jgi:hypothetical protein
MQVYQVARSIITSNLLLIYLHRMFFIFSTPNLQTPTLQTTALDTMNWCITSLTLRVLVVVVPFQVFSSAGLSRSVSHPPLPFLSCSEWAESSSKTKTFVFSFWCRQVYPLTHPPQELGSTFAPRVEQLGVTSESRQVVEGGDDVLKMDVLSAQEDLNALCSERDARYRVKREKNNLSTKECIYLIHSFVMFACDQLMYILSAVSMRRRRRSLSRIKVVIRRPGTV